LSLNQSLATACYLREDLSQIWQQADYGTAYRVLHDWCARARTSGIRVLQIVADTL
jgi:hypothetical protein